MERRSHVIYPLCLLIVVSVTCWLAHSALRVALAGTIVMRSPRSLCSQRWRLIRETWSSTVQRRWSTRDPNLQKPCRKRDPGILFCFTHQHIVLNTTFVSFSEALSIKNWSNSSFWLLNKNRHWHVFQFHLSQLRWAKDKAAGEDRSLPGSDRGENEDHWGGEERDAGWANPVIDTAPDRLQHKHIDTSASVLYRFWSNIDNQHQSNVWKNESM